MFVSASAFSKTNKECASLAELFSCIGKSYARKKPTIPKMIGFISTIFKYGKSDVFTNIRPYFSKNILFILRHNCSRFHSLNFTPFTLFQIKVLSILNGLLLGFLRMLIQKIKPYIPRLQAHFHKSYSFVPSL